MDHDYWAERLQGYIDNELAPADRHAMDQHTQHCPECQKDVAYMRVLKGRFKAYDLSVDTPKDLESRMKTLIAKRRRLNRARVWSLGVAVAAVAASLFFLFPRATGDDDWKFEDVILTGKMTCHNCEIAKHTHLPGGSLCLLGHHLGLRCSNGIYYEIAGDVVGKGVITDDSLHNKQVRIYGQVLDREHLLIVKNLERMDERRASL